MKNERGRTRTIPPPRYEWILTSDAARQLGVDPSTVTRWARYGEIPAKKEGGRWYLRQSVVTERKLARAAAHGASGDIENSSSKPVAE
jgi:excisionase family DNA binding protein